MIQKNISRKENKLSYEDATHRINLNRIKHTLKICIEESGLIL